MFNGNVPSLSDIAAVTGNNNGFGDGNGWWVLIILFAIFGGWGNNGLGYGGGGAQEGYVLATDFATIERKLDGVNNGICSLGYDQLAQMNGINTNIMTAASNLSAQLNAMSANEQACCCATQNLITSGFADLNYNLATQECNTRQAVANASREIIDNDNANYRALNDRLTAMEMAAKDDKIASLSEKVSALNLAASQAAQNNYIIGQLRPAPVPAYTVANPYAGSYNYCGCNC